jgi:hypothetical protein
MPLRFSLPQERFDPFFGIFRAAQGRKHVAKHVQGLVVRDIFHPIEAGFADLQGQRAFGRQLGG